MKNQLAPIRLDGKNVSLVPLEHEYDNELSAAISDGNLHRLWYTSIPAPEHVDAETTRRLELRDAGSMLPFVVLNATGRAVGMTTYMNIDVASPRVEIGSTWYARSVQRGPVNTEAKLLLLTHAFEKLGCIAVEFRTHTMNFQSRKAIERLGAKLDGVLRAHMVMSNGTLRDTACYSVTAPEWPAVKANLEWQLEKPR